MSQFLFIHGTSVRKVDYNETIYAIERRLKARGHTVLPCLWGDYFGTPEKGWGRSIPGFADAEPLPADPNAALWILLFQDPFFRLRELKSEEFSAFPEDPWQSFLDLVIPPEFLSLVADRGLTPYWEQTLGALRDGGEFQAVLSGIPKAATAFSEEMAQAMVAALLLTAIEAGAPSPMPPFRDELVTWLTQAIGVEKGLFDRPLSFVFRGARNATMRIFMKYAADVLLYQSRGKAIRTAVRNAIEAAGGPVIVLAHSLGGVAAVDVLAGEDLRHKVSHLITAGSQAPFLYDVNALHSLPQVKALPEFFPEKWLNIYDESDLLSFLAEPAFSPARVTDFPNDSRLPPLAAHSAYWDSDGVWERILEFVQ